jgi:hypothetical protein
MPEGGRPRPSSYRCPRCRKPIARTAHVIFDSGDLFHRECFDSHGGLMEIVAQFLRDKAPATFCHACLSVILGIAYQNARRTVTILRLTPEFTVLTGERCSGCQNQRVTIRAEASAAPSR